MRRVFVVLLLLSVMLGLQVLGSATEVSRPMTLAAIGFVVLAAFAFAELGGRWKLPKVTGYIVAGVILGPFAVGVLSPTVVEDLGMFNTLAVGLIATTAGLELEIASIRRVFKTLMTTIAAKIVLACGLVGAFIYLVEPFVGLTDVPNGPFALAVLMGTIAIGTSPSVTLAVIEETRAKGRLTDLVLAAAVFKDVVVVVALAIGVAVANSALGGGAFSIEVLGHVGLELLASMGAGAVLGVILLLYMRFIGAEMLLFVAAMVLVIAEISAALHLELLLVFIVAGFVVRNFSEREHQLLEPLQRVSLPVFIIFFTNAGANVDLPVAVTVLPLAAGVCVVRAVAYIASGAIGGRVGEEEPEVRKNAWLAYIPQAGVTLGLIGFASKNVPQVSDAVWNLGMAVVALNLFVGPVLSRIALARAGETADAKGAAPGDEGVVGEGERVGLPPALEAQLKGVVASVAASLDRLSSRTVEPIARRDLKALGQAITPQGLLELPPTDATGLDEIRRILGSTYERVRDDMHRFPVEIVVSVSREELAPREGEGFPRRFALGLRRFGSYFLGRARRRHVPVRVAARYTVEPLVAEALLTDARHVMRFRARAYEELRRVARGTAPIEDAKQAFEALNAELGDRTRRTREHLTRRIEIELSGLLAELDTPRRAVRTVRFSRIHPKIESQLAALDRELKDWPEHETALRCGIEYTRAGELFVREAEAELLDGFGARVRAAHEAQAEELTAALERLAPLRAELEGKGEVDLDAIVVRFGALVPKPAQKRMSSLEQKLQAATATQAIASRARATVAAATNEGAVTLAPDRLISAEKPSDAPISSFDTRAAFERVFLARMVPAVEERVDAAATHVTQVAREWRDVVRALTVTTDLGQEELSGSRRIEALLQASERAASGLATTLNRAETEFQADWEALERAIGDARDELERILSEAGGESLGHRETKNDFGTMVQDFRGRVADRLETWRENLSDLLSDGTTAQWAQQYKMRGSAGSIDARTIRTFLDRRAKARKVELPVVLDRLLDGSAVADPRLLVLHDAELERIVTTERSWMRGVGAGTTAVVGASGVGKTSLLSIARLRLGVRRIVFLKHTGRHSHTDLWTSLAREVGVSGERLADALMRERRAILIDDLHAWFPPTRAGLQALTNFANLVAETHKTTFWLVSLDVSLVRALTGAHSLMTVFENILLLRPSTPQGLEEVIRSRHDTAGIELHLEPSGIGKALPRLGPRLAERTAFQMLAGASHGSLRSAHRLWRAQLTMDADGRAHAGGVRMLDASLPFIRSFDATTVALLVLLTRYETLSTRELSEATGELPAEIGRRLVSLSAASLLVADGRRWRVKPTLRDELYAALVEIGALEDQ